MKELGHFIAERTEPIQHVGQQKSIFSYKACQGTSHRANQSQPARPCEPFALGLPR